MSKSAYLFQNSNKWEVREQINRLRNMQTVEQHTPVETHKWELSWVNVGGEKLLFSELNVYLLEICHSKSYRPSLRGWKMLGEQNL